MHSDVQPLIVPEVHDVKEDREVFYPFSSATVVSIEGPSVEGTLLDPSTVIVLRMVTVTELRKILNR